MAEAKIVLAYPSYWKGYAFEEIIALPRRVRLQPNHRRILEAILFLIDEAGRRGTYLTQYDIVKSLFIADTQHLNQFGRPITFDNYAALYFGPVPEVAYDMLKPSYNAARHFQEAWPIWQRVPSESDGRRAFKFINLRRQPNVRVLSSTDRSALESALVEVKKLKFGGVVDKTHKHPAWLKAWQENGPKQSYPMDYSLLFDDPDEEAAEDIERASKFTV